MDIQQSSVSSCPDDTVKFGLSQVPTQLSEHLQLTKSSSTDQSSSGNEGFEIHNS